MLATAGAEDLSPPRPGQEWLGSTVIWGVSSNYQQGGAADTDPKRKCDPVTMEKRFTNVEIGGPASVLTALCLSLRG